MLRPSRPSPFQTGPQGLPVPSLRIKIRLNLLRSPQSFTSSSETLSYLTQAVTSLSPLSGFFLFSRPSADIPTCVPPSGVASSARPPRPHTVHPHAFSAPRCFDPHAVSQAYCILLPAMGFAIFPALCPTCSLLPAHKLRFKSHSQFARAYALRSLSLADSRHTSPHDLALLQLAIRDA